MFLLLLNLQIYIRLAKFPRGGEMPPSGCAAGRRILGTHGKSCRRKRLRGGTRRSTGTRRLLLLLQAECEREECYRMEFVMSPASGTTCSELDPNNAQNRFPSGHCTKLVQPFTVSLRPVLCTTCRLAAALRLSNSTQTLEVVPGVRSAVAISGLFTL